MLNNFKIITTTIMVIAVSCSIRNEKVALRMLNYRTDYLEYDDYDIYYNEYYDGDEYYYKDVYSYDYGSHHRKTTKRPRRSKCDYRYYVEKYDMVDWYTADKRCKRRGMDGLVRVDNSEKYAAVIDEVRKAGVSGYRIWLGATDRKQEGLWVWENLSGRLPMSYANWAAGEPNSANSGPEDCLEMLTNYFWNDSNCNQGRNLFICEKFECYTVH